MAANQVAENSCHYENLAAPLYNPLTEGSKGMFTLLVALAIIPIVVVADLVRVVTMSGRHLTPYQLNRRRATVATFIAALSLYVLHSGAWLFRQLPSWVPLALIVLVGLSLLFLLAGLYAVRNERPDLFGALTSLVVAGGGAALLWWQWYLPPDSPAANEANFALAGLYIAALIAALVRTLICTQVFGGAARIVARAMRRRATGMRPASSPSSGFWAEMRASFERGRTGR